MQLIDQVRLIIDFGLVVLTWIVQLVVYPGFKYYAKTDLLQWHEKYTWRITIVVLPLMAGQLGMHVYAVYDTPSILNTVMLFIVFSTWLITFISAVPLHHSIAGNTEMEDALSKLRKVHSWRTMCWTLVFILGVITIKTV